MLYTTIIVTPSMLELLLNSKDYGVKNMYVLGIVWKE